MFPTLRLKTKLVIAATSMVAAVVAVLSSLYISQILKQQVDYTFQSGEFVALEVFDSSREALSSDFTNARGDVTSPAFQQRFIRESLQSDPGLNSLLQSVVGYSPTIYDVAITDVSGKAIVHTDAGQIDKTVPQREDLVRVRNGGMWRQLSMVYGAPSVYEVRLPMQRNGSPFAVVRVGVSTIFLRRAIRPQLVNALFLSGIAILLAMMLAAFLSNLALRPLEAISSRLDEMSGAAAQPLAPKGDTDEFGVVSTKIDRLGKQMKDVKEVFSALKENIDQIMANLQDGVVLFSRENKAILVSASVESFLHKSRAELLGCDVEEIFADRPRIGRIVLDAFATHQPISNVEVLADGQRDGTGSARVQLSLDFIEEDGERIGALITLRDAESVHRIEDELELSRRMAAVGRLTSGVAHEVKNPINAIVVHLEVLRQKLGVLEPDAKRHIDVIGSEIRRLDRVVQTLVDFTRPMELRLQPTDLRKVVEDVVMLASPDAEKHGVHVVQDVTDEPLPVKIDSDLVKQAVFNVVINGLQAMGDRGTIWIRAHRKDGMAEIAITDQGGGIPPEVREKIFNLYFTTKKGGSGIGLPMTYRVVQLHNGEMRFDSIMGEGTTFLLRFPIVEAAREPLMIRERSTVEG